MSEVFKVPAPVSEKKRVAKRALSPQPSTSSAPYTPFPLEDDDEELVEAKPVKEPVKEPVKPPVKEPVKQPAKQPVKEPVDSVYAHVENIGAIGQLTGLKSGRRRGRWRKLHQARFDYKLSEAVKILQPILLEEAEKQQCQHVLIASALDHFANTINGIADKLEGKTDPTNFTERLEAFKKKAAELREKRRAKNPNAAEFLRGPPPPPPKLSEEETLRRLREETEAAVEALLTGDKSKEKLPDVFSEVLAAFKKMT